MSLITVWPDAFPNGWDGNADWTFTHKRSGQIRKVPTFHSVELGPALEAWHHTDAHFVPYYLTNRLSGATVPHAPRLKIAALTGGGLERMGLAVRFDSLVFDVDDPVAHEHNKRLELTGGQPMHARPDWRAEVCAALAALPVEWASRLGWYETRGGYRLLWGLPVAVDPRRYASIYVRMLRFLEEHGITADPACKDWTRCYRLPRVMRSGQWQNRPLDVQRLAWPTEPAMIAKVLELTPHVAGGILKGLDGLGGPVELPEIIEENRNMALTSIAGRLRRHVGMEGPELLETLTMINEGRCDPPLPQEEIDKIASSVSGYDAPAMPGSTESEAKELPADPLLDEEVRFALGSEVEIAEEVAKELERDTGVGLVFDRGRLWRYSPPVGLWHEIPPERVVNLVAWFDGDWVATGKRNQDGSPKVARLKVSKRLASDVSKLLNLRRTSPGWFDEAPRGVAFRNGFVTVDAAGHIHVNPHDPRWRANAGLGFDFAAGCVPHEFVKMLRACFYGCDDVDERIELLREVTGAALLGVATDFQRALLLVGEGANGKSTFLDVVSALFPEHAITSVPPQMFGDRPSRARLSLSRLNVISELPEADILEAETVKAVIDGSRLEGKFLYQDPFMFRVTAATIAAANNLPAVRDMTHGFWRRWLVVEWPREFAEEEQERNLATRIIGTELAAVAAWAIEGAARLMRAGRYSEPSSSKKHLDEWRRRADPVKRYVESELEPCNVEEGLASSALFTAYRLWAETNGHGKMSSVKFADRLKSLKVKNTRTASGRKWALKARLRKSVIENPFTGGGNTVIELTDFAKAENRGVSS